MWRSRTLTHFSFESQRAKSAALETSFWTEFNPKMHRKQTWTFWFCNLFRRFWLTLKATAHWQLLQEMQIITDPLSLKLKTQTNMPTTVSQNISGSASIQKQFLFQLLNWGDLLLFSVFISLYLLDSWLTKGSGTFSPNIIWHFIEQMINKNRLMHHKNNSQTDTKQSTCCTWHQTDWQCGLQVKVEPTGNGGSKQFKSY